MTTIYLPIALISVWGQGTSHASPAIAESLWKVLDHTMALVSAVSLACLHTMTPDRMTAYRENILTWIANLQVIHPMAEHHVNKHMAVHIFDFLKLFGPIRSWCFPFEHLIGQLQHLPNNHKFGQSFPALPFSIPNH